MLPATAELQPPVGYDDRWLVLAVAAVVLVTAYFVVVWWTTRPPTPTRTRTLLPSRSDGAPAQRCLAALDDIETAATEGRLGAREAHQRLSGVVRAFVEESSSTPAASMTLTTLRATGPAPVADLVAVLYPPEFEPGEPGPDQLRPVLDRARVLVTTWR